MAEPRDYNAGTSTAATDPVPQRCRALPCCSANGLHPLPPTLGERNWSLKAPPTFFWPCNILMSNVLESLKSEYLSLESENPLPSCYWGAVTTVLLIEEKAVHCYMATTGFFCLSYVTTQVIFFPPHR